MNRAYSLLEVKEITEGADFFTVTGIATTPSPDRMNDVVDPLGAKFAADLPMLWQHNADKPVGRVSFSKPTKSGIPFAAKIPNVKEAGVLKDRIDEAIQSIKYRLVAAVSIGFRVLNDAFERMPNGGLKFNEIEIMELSFVTIPANADATIQTIKSFDTQLRAASGNPKRPVVALIAANPPASGPRKYVELIPRDPPG